MEIQAYNGSQPWPAILLFRHRYLWHQAQGFSPAQFQEKVTAIVRRELKRAGVALPGLA